MRWFFLVFLFSSLTAMAAQYGLDYSLPTKIQLNEPFTLTITINKGNYSGFSTYMMDLPDNIIVKEEDSRGGNFMIRDGRLSIAWPSTSKNEKFLIIRMKVMLAGRAPNAVIQHKWIYVNDDSKIELKGTPIQITEQEHGAVVIQSQPVPEPVTEKQTEEPVETVQESSPPVDELQQQINQLRSDSREAFKIGAREKQVALDNISAARKDSIDAMTLYGPNQRKAALAAASASLSRYRADLETAEKILTLAGELQHNAEDFEKLNKSTEDGVKPSATVAEKAQPGEKVSVLYQTVQLRNDAREAMNTGLLEKRRAEEKLEMAESLLAEAPKIKDPAWRQATVNKATQDKKNALNEIVIAEKIIAVAQAMESNATELDQLNLPEKPKTKPKPKTTPQQTVVDEKPAEKREPAVSPVKQEKPSVPMSAQLSEVYRVQIGSFAKPPDASAFNKLGKVEILLEDGRYRVMYGRFKTRDEAYASIEGLRQKGFDGFIVTFINGVRQK